MFVRAIAGLMLAAAVAVVSLPAAAQTFPEGRIAIMSHDGIMRESLAAQNVREQVEALRRRYTTEIQSREQELRQADDELVQQRSLLDRPVFEQRRTELQARAESLQQLVQQRRRELDEAAGMAMRQVEEAVVRIVATMAENRGINIVLDSSQVIIASVEYDITAQVLERLNAELTAVTVTVPTQ